MITLRQFSAQETIVREGERGESAFVIERGRVEVLRAKEGKDVHIACLEKGATFGEMNLVDDLPRDATVVALEETLVRELHRDDLHSTMRHHPDMVIALLHSLFDRLREANARLARLAPEGKAAAPAPVTDPAPATAVGQDPAKSDPSNPFAPKPAQFVLEGLTPRAIEAMPQNPFPIRLFPFKIGRKSQDPLVNNHLSLPDQHPLQISRHHVSLIKEGDRLGVTDCGSHLGAIVDGTRIGGDHGPGPAFFKGQEGILVLGNDTSPYQFRIKPA